MGIQELTFEPSDTEGTLNIPHPFAPFPWGGGNNSLTTPGAPWALGPTGINGHGSSPNIPYTLYVEANGVVKGTDAGQVLSDSTFEAYCFGPYDLSGTPLVDITFILSNGDPGTTVLYVDNGSVNLYTFEDAIDFVKGGASTGPFGYGGAPTLPTPTLYLYRAGIVNWARSMTWGQRQQWSGLNLGGGLGLSYVGATPLMPIAGVRGTYLPPGIGTELTGGGIPGSTV
jgi:hypothetical protein